MKPRKLRPVAGQKHRQKPQGLAAAGMQLRETGQATNHGRGTAHLVASLGFRGSHS